MSNFFKTYWPGLVLLVIFFIISITIYQDYGLGSDEDGQMLIGEHFYTYAFDSDTSFHNYIERDHGSGFEIPLKIIEKKFQITDSRDIFLMRHIVSNLFFLLCMFSGYVLAFRLFNNKWLASLAFIALVLHPRLYAHSYFNSKDIPAMGTFLLALTISRWAFLKDRPLPYMLLGIIIGYSASIRLMNIIILGPLFLFYVIDLIIVVRQRKPVFSKLFSFLLFFTGFCITLYICWPTLWGHPIENLIHAYKSLAVFRWQGNLLFAGTVLPSDKITWSYIPTWMLITTPEAWLAFGLLGIMFLIVATINDPVTFFTNTVQRNFLLALMCFVLPVLTVIKLQSILYDDWRHLYFIYPPFVILFVYGLNELLKKPYKSLLWVVCFIQIGAICRFMIKAHPNQQVYFNFALSHKPDSLQKLYELDYWGSSNKTGLEWIIQNDMSDTIYINNAWILGFNTAILSPKDRKRFVQTNDESQLDYYVENFRTVPYKYPKENSVYNLDVHNSTVLRITKLK